MATAVSGTGPTYVFLVMEALIDAAVHLGFPRHIAHDLVIETLEGSTLFAKQSGMHPAELRNMVTSPGGTSAAALHELESGRLRTVLSEAVWAAFRRTVELGDQLEAQRRRPAAKDRPTPTMTSSTAVDGRGDLRRPARASLTDPRDSTCARPIATSGPTRRRSWDRLLATWAGLDDAAWHLPGAAPSDAGGPDWSLAEHVGHLADWQELAIEYVAVAIATGRWPTDDDYDGGDFDRFNERLPRAWTTMPRTRSLARFDRRDAALLAVGATACPRRRSAPTRPGAGSTRPCTATTSTTSRSSSRGPTRCGGRQTDGDPFVADPRAGRP